MTIRALVLAMAVACGSSAPADFSVTSWPGPLSAMQGMWATGPLTVAGTYTGDVTFAASGLPAGASATFTPAAVTLAAGRTTPAGTYPVTITATGGAIAHAVSVSWTVTARPANTIQTVFVIVMENHNWSDIQGSASAPYINGTLLPQASWAANYLNVPRLHPSLPNYLWLEAGTNFGVLDDGEPAAHHQSTGAHLVAQLSAAGVSWKSYQENIDGATCPLTASGLYAPKHNPMVYFDDVTDSNSASSANCIAHVRPFTELGTDLSGNHVAQYNFITPNLCDDMHGASGCPSDLVAAGDTWLSHVIPQITASAAYQSGGAIFVTWDESEGIDGPIGMIVLSPKAKGGGSHNSIAYSHSSTLRTMQELFAVGPPLGGAAGAPDLAELFSTFP